MIGQEVHAEILRLFHAEKWRVGTIATQLGVHPGVVRRVILEEGTARARPIRARKVDPYLSFIREKLLEYPTVPASRLYHMVRERGYTGKESQLRAVVAELRPRRTGEAFLRLKTLPGEQAQVDWAHFGKVTVGRATRPLVGFVMTLSHSRAVYLSFYHSQELSMFLDAHDRAFSWFQGVPRVCLYDNLKSVVIERMGQHIRFNNQFLSFAGAYRFLPRPVGVRRGNEKGRVERAIGYIRTSFFPCRTFKDLSDLNRQAALWCETTSLDRGWQEDKRKTVREVLAEERPLLLPLPEAPFPLESRVSASVAKTPYVRFDLNDYSVPPRYVRRTVTVLASVSGVRVVDGTLEIARHCRSYDRGVEVTDPAHIDELRAEKADAREHAGHHRLIRLVPETGSLLELRADAGRALDPAVRELDELLSTYGREALGRAVRAVLDTGSSDTAAVRRHVEEERVREGRAPALPLSLPDKPGIRQTTRRTTLSDYKKLTQDSNDEE